MPGDDMEPNLQSKPTGKVLVVFDPDDPIGAERVIKDKTGVASLDDDGDHRIYPELGIAVITPPDRDSDGSIQALAEGSGPILTAEAEQFVGVTPIGTTISAQEVDSSSPYTWGLDVTNVVRSKYSGKGVKVAILDTGFDFNHPGFKSRSIQSKSFVEGQGVQDGHGHGTHCTGTACGSKNPEDSKRYGVAHEADIYIGKVLGNDGGGVDGSILAGIDWAIKQGCDIISMSLGGPVALDVLSSDSSVYELVARRALEKNILIIAAAGNNSRRRYKPPFVNPVNRPANARSILAVGAIDSDFQVGWFSNGGLNISASHKGGAVDIAGPGVNVYSSWPVEKGKYMSLNGTSMATPHIAGIAALYAEATGKRGQALWDCLIENAKPIDLEPRDVGRGLVQAPS